MTRPPERFSEGVRKLTKKQDFFPDASMSLPPEKFCIRSCFLVQTNRQYINSLLHNIFISLREAAKGTKTFTPPHLDNFFLQLMSALYYAPL